MHEGLIYYVYLLASRKHGTLYLGVTNNLVRRIREHRTKLIRGFSAKYGVIRLVWYEAHHHPTAAIAREKQIKNSTVIGKSRYYGANPYKPESPAEREVRFL